VDDVLLVASELVTNGIRHAQTPLTLSLSRNGNVMLLSVHDGSAKFPSARSSAQARVGGYGMGIIEVLSLAWGVDTDNAGKVIWATFDTDPEKHAQPDTVALAPRQRPIDL
jgi:hypothetical protein